MRLIAVIAFVLLNFPINTAEFFSPVYKYFISGGNSNFPPSSLELAEKSNKEKETGEVFIGPLHFKPIYEEYDATRQIKYLQLEVANQFSTQDHSGACAYYAFETARVLTKIMDGEKMMELKAMNVEKLSASPHFVKKIELYRKMVHAYRLLDKAGYIERQKFPGNAEKAIVDEKYKDAKKGIITQMPGLWKEWKTMTIADVENMVQQGAKIDQGILEQVKICIKGIGGDWLEKSELLFLWKCCGRKGHFLDNIPLNVITEHKMLQDKDVLLNPEKRAHEAMQVMQIDKNPFFVWPFLMGTSVTYGKEKEKIRGTNGHWLPVIYVQKKNNRTGNINNFIITADSDSRGGHTIRGKEDTYVQAAVNWIDPKPMPEDAEEIARRQAYLSLPKNSQGSGGISNFSPLKNPEDATNLAKLFCLSTNLEKI
jgi:hypothetical protein